MEIAIEVTPASLGSRGQRFRATWLGVDLGVSRTPFYASARALLALGVAPDAWLEMRHRGSATVAMRGRVGAAALLSVSEPDRGVARTVLYVPRE